MVTPVSVRSASTAHDRFDALLRRERRGQNLVAAQLALVVAAVLVSLWWAGIFDWERLSEGLPAIGVVVSEMIPPDFTRWQQWVKPMVDTIAMSVAGTTLAVVLSLPLAFLAAKNTTPMSPKEVRVGVPSFRRGGMRYSPMRFSFISLSRSL